MGQPNLHDHARPRRMRPLWAERRRRRRDRTGGDRRPGRHAGARRRSPLRPRRAMEAGVSREPRRDASDPRQPSRRRPDSARPGRQDRDRRRRVIHLSRRRCNATCRCALPCAAAICKAPSSRPSSESRTKSIFPKACIWNGRASTANCRQANRRFEVVVPFALLLIAGVLYAATHIADRHLRHHGADSGRVPRRNVRAVSSPARRSACRPPSASSRFSASPSWTASC